MNDDRLISLNAAIDVIEAGRLTKLIDAETAVNGLKALPSAQPSATDTNVATTDSISRAAVVDAIEGVDWYHINKNGEMVHGANSAEHQAWYKADDIYAAIERVPPAQPERKGKWIYHSEIGWGDTWLCDQCGEKTTSTVMGKPRANYCPMCGADMRGEQA